jgi:hypothetical protein
MSKLTEIQEKMARLQEELGALRRQKNAELAGELREAFRTAFDDNPGLKGFSWTQYTPYFNDGSPCKFSVRADEVQVAWVGDDGLEKEDEYVALHSGKSYDHPGDEALKKICGSLRPILRALDEDFLRDLFGDHVRVRVDCDGITTEDYDHD